MFEFLFLADAEVNPCEVVRFEYVSTAMELYHAGSIYHFIIRARGTSERFEDGRLYIVRTTAFSGEKPKIEYGFLAGKATLVRKEYEEQLASGETVEVDYVDRVLDVGVFYPSKELAKNECAKVSNEIDSVNKKASQSPPFL